MEHYILCMLVLMVPGPFLWAMTADKQQKQVMLSLIEAIESGVSEEELQLLLQKGADINEVDNKGRTPLYMAVDQGNEEAAAFLVSQGAAVERNLRGWDRYGDFDIVPLAHAAQRDRLPFVIFLVAHGACINAIDKLGLTALANASLDGHTDIVVFLLEQADLDICYRCKKNTIFRRTLNLWEHKTALEYAAHHRHFATAHMISTKIDLIKKKILWLSSLCLPEGLLQVEQVEWFERLKAKIKRRILQIHTIDIVDENGNTPLHRAVLAGNYPLAFWILSIQPLLILRENKPTLRENESEEEVSGKTPLHCDVGWRGMYAELQESSSKGIKKRYRKV